MVTEPLFPVITYGRNQSNLTEAQFQGQIWEGARFYGWIRKFHNTYAIGSDRGYPDLTLVHPRHGVIWLEVKGPRGRVRPEQIAWLRDLRTAGFHAYVVYPWDIPVVDQLLLGRIPEPERGTGKFAPEVQPLIDHEAPTKPGRRH